MHKVNLRGYLTILVGLLVALSATTMTVTAQEGDDAENDDGFQRPTISDRAEDYVELVCGDPGNDHDRDECDKFIDDGAPWRDHDPFDDNDDRGSDDDLFAASNYVVMNMSNGGIPGFFGIYYGRGDDPGAIGIFSMSLEFLGGATVLDEEGGNVPFLSTVPIPVANVFGQVLAYMFEFGDLGVGGDNNTTEGANNGLFDAERDGNRIGNWDLGQTEPIYRALDLTNVNWERGIIQKVEHSDSNISWHFTLTATNLPYTVENNWWVGGNSQHFQDSDQMVNRIAFDFHLGFEVDKQSVAVPWYEVKVSGGGINGNEEEFALVSSEQVDNRTFDGAAMQARFKYDHTIEGWDFQHDPNDANNTEQDLLMMETMVVRAMFVPGIVNNWAEEQFGTTVAQNVTFEVDDNAIDYTVNTNLGESQRLSGNDVQFTDNFQRDMNLPPDEIAWVSDVAVHDSEDNTSNDQMYFQVHAGETGTFYGDEAEDDNINEDASVSAIVILGGYIYPAGDYIHHDPTFVANAITLDLFQDLFVGAGGAAVLAVLGLILAAIIFVVRKRKARKVVLDAQNRQIQQLQAQVDAQ